ncbi:hypothetical protein ACLOJK_032874 [Asimina triloba]
MRGREAEERRERVPLLPLGFGEAQSLRGISHLFSVYIVVSSVLVPRDECNETLCHPNTTRKYAFVHDLREVGERNGNATELEGNYSISLREGRSGPRGRGRAAPKQYLHRTRG